MIIKPDLEQQRQLKELWHNVFGDDISYINLLFDFEIELCDTFVKQENGKIVSVLYLLNCFINFEGKNYKGKYLYAAATDPEYRGKGLMTELIKEAQLHCVNEGLDFISLVPANEGLYNYYSKFGFETAMHRYKTLIRKLPDDDISTAKRMTDCSSSVIEKFQSNFKDNRFFYHTDDLQYAINCINNTERNFYINSCDSYYIADNDMSVIYEFISSGENFKENFQKMLSCFKGNIKIYSPYDLSEYGETKKEKYGMIYPINAELKRQWSQSDIYMNLALD